ncbi:MAG: peroxiredoxin [Pseudomonadota bacterium]|nr:peroxiredoxin [Pseudomonadota bacterium]
MTIKVGDKLPNITLSTMAEEGPKPISVEELCAGKKVVLFAVPGAFTPTCSNQHLPGFVSNSAALKEKGVDLVACISVNDPFVMAAWSKDRNAAEGVLMLADGNAEFTSAIGLEMDVSGFGMGMRSQRYSMVIDNGVVSSLNVESGPVLDVSSAETILEAL